MLNIEIHDNKNHKILYYRNADDIAVRVVILDFNNNFIQDVISEYDKTGRNICDVLFGKNPTEIIAYREYHFHDNEKYDSGWTDYKKVNGEFIKLHSKHSYFIVQNELSRCDWFYDDGKLAFYDLFKFYDDIGEMCKEYSYFPNGKMILDYCDVPKLEHFDDYYLELI